MEKNKEKVLGGYFMKLLLLNPPYQYASLPPLGIAYIASVLEENGFEVDCVDAAFEKLGWKNIRQMISHKNPDIVGIPVTTIMFKQAIQTAKIIKEFDSNIKILMGGPHATTDPNSLLKYKFVDFAIRGEGEYTTLELVKNFNKIAKIRGLSYKKNRRIVHNPERNFITDLDELPYPARHFFDIKKYRGQFNDGIFYVGYKPQTHIMASRGCPFRCTFCSKIFGRTLRLRNPIKVVDEMEMLKNDYGIKEVMFFDDNIFVNMKWIQNFCKELINRNLNISWKAQSRVEITEANLKLAKKSGCNYLFFGIESGSNRVLKLMKKDMNLRQAEKIFTMCHKFGINTHAFLIIGYPGERLNDIKKTEKFIRKVKPDSVSFFHATPFPGSELYDIIKKNGHRIPSYEDYYLIGDGKSGYESEISKELLSKCIHNYFLPFLRYHDPSPYIRSLFASSMRHFLKRIGNPYLWQSLVQHYFNFISQKLKDLTVQKKIIEIVDR